MNFGNKKFIWKATKLIILIAVAAMLIISALLYTKISTDSEEFSLEEDGYISYCGSTKNITSNSNFNLADANGLPIYFENKIMTTIQSIYYLPFDFSSYMIEEGTMLSTNSRGGITIKKGTSERRLEKGFVYDGNDFYIFLEPVTLYISGYEFNLPTYSYVEAVSGQEYIIFDCETRKSYSYRPTNDAIVYPKDKKYEISLVFDSLTSSSGKKILLFGEPSQIEPAL